MSRTAQATRKYSCTSRNSRPATTESDWIQKAGNILRADLLFHGADVVAAIENLDVEIIRRAGAEQAQKIYRLAVVAGHRHVIRNPEHDLVVGPVLPVVFFGIAQILHPPIERNDDRLLGTRNLKRRSVRSSSGLVFPAEIR